MSEKRKKILVVNPITTSVFDRFDERYLRERAGSGITLDVESLTYGVETIESDYDDVLCAPYIVDKVIEAQERKYDAAIIDCFRDPGLGAAREATDIVVVGPGEASMLFSMALGDTFTIISMGTETYRRRMPPLRVRQLGISDRFVSEWGVGMTVASIPHFEDKIASRLVSVAKQIQRVDEPDVLVLGCTGLSRVVDRVSREVEIPLIDPSIAALSMAQALLSSKFKRSRNTYPRPGKKARNVPGTKFLK